MTNKERIVKSEKILQEQNSGKISREEAARQFDEMLMEESRDGLLIYYSDSTGLTAPWDKDVMLFPKVGSTMDHRIPSNTGIYARGSKRGILITRPSGAEPDCIPETLQHFQKGSKGWER